MHNKQKGKGAGILKMWIIKLAMVLIGYPLIWKRDIKFYFHLYAYIGLQFLRFTLYIVGCQREQKHETNLY